MGVGMLGYYILYFIDSDVPATCSLKEVSWYYYIGVRRRTPGPPNWRLYHCDVIGSSECNIIIIIYHHRHRHRLRGRRRHHRYYYY